MRKFLLILFTLLAVPQFILWAGTTGKLTGKVVDKNTQEPLPFVSIIVEGTKFGATTDVDGNYVILNLPPGKYIVRAQYLGYQTIVMENVPISVDLTTTRNFEMAEASVELSTVVIQGAAQKIQKDITSSQASVSSDQISALPVAELSDVLQLQAGVTKDAGGGFHIRGGRSSEIAYWVNGVSITDAFDNSQGIQIDNSSVQELQVISGTFNAEYGNAMSGIINTVTKEGGSEYHGDFKAYGSDHASNFTSFFPHIDKFDPVSSYNLQGSLSGPVPFTARKLAFFVNARYNYDDGYLYGENRYTTTGERGDGSVVAMNWAKRYLGQANFSYWPTQSIKLNLEGLFSKDDFQDYDHSYRWAPEGNVNKYGQSYNTTLTVTHMLNSSTFYTLKGTYFNRNFKERLYGSESDPRYLAPESLFVPTSYSFRTKGTNLHRFERSTETMNGKIDFTSQVSENHLLKIGAEAKSHVLYLEDYNLEALTINNQPVQPFTPVKPSKASINYTDYTYYPFEFSGYIQDKIEYESVIINLGLRFDYFDSRGKVLVDPSDPNIFNPLRPEYQEMVRNGVDQSAYESAFYKKASPKSQISPRFGIAYPISASGVVHFSYGTFLQIPPFQYLYNRGLYKLPETGNGIGVFGNADLEAQKTIMYEIGFRQEFFDEFSADVTGYYRDVRNWITAGPFVPTSNNVTYSTYINKDYSNVKGITVNLSKRFSNMYSIDLNYTYQVAEGSNSSPEDEYQAQLGSNEPTLYLIPMEWDQRHLINLSIFVGENTWGVSLLGRYGTGLPYTPAITQATADRDISTGLDRNSRRRPNQVNLDLKLHKTFPVFGLNITSFLRVFNLLDNRTVVNVFGDTGKADYTTETRNIGYDVNRPNSVQEYTRYPWNYAEPRNIQFGFEFSF